MTTGTPALKPLRRDAEANRRRVLDAAETVFTEQGLDASVDAVVKASGVGTGTFYRRFPDKDALIDELVTDLVDRLAQVARDCLAGCTAGTGLEEFLLAAGRVMQRRKGCLPRVWRVASDPTRVAEVRALLADLLSDAQRHGRVSEALRPADVSMTLWALTGVIEISAAVDPDAWKRHLEIVLAGMRQPGLAPARAALTPAQLADVSCTRRG